MKRTGLKRGSGLQRGGLSKSRKPINKFGPVAKERAARKKLWEKEHPPKTDDIGNQYYLCHICLYFGESERVAYVLFERYVLEHKIPKGKLSLEESQLDENLGPSHVICNTEKGSQYLWQMEQSPINKLPNPHVSQ